MIAQLYRKILLISMGFLLLYAPGNSQYQTIPVKELETSKVKKSKWTELNKETYQQLIEDKLRYKWFHTPHIQRPLSGPLHPQRY